MPVLSKAVVKHYQRGEFAEADRLCAELLENEPDNIDALYMRGILALTRKDFSAAEAFISRAVAQRDDECDMHVNLGMALLGAGKIDEAGRALDRAIALDPASADAHLYLARCRLIESRLKEAEQSVDDALAARPDWTEALEVKAATFMRAGRFDEAAELATEVIRREPSRSDCYRVLADIATRHRRYGKALKHYRAALERNPTNIEALSNLAVLLGRLGLHSKAIVMGRKALALDPGNASMRYNLGTSLLALGKFQEGWQCYAARLGIPANTLAKRPMAAARLTKLPEFGMRILAWADQGLGEQIMFASMVPQLVETGATISLECDGRLVPLFQRSFPGVEVLPCTNPPHHRLSEKLDGQFSLPDAAPWLRRDFSSFPKHRGYLRANVNRSTDLRAKYRAEHKPLIGISWRTAHQAKVSREKTVPLPEWAPLLHIPGATFVSLQYGATSDEISIAELAANIRIVADTEIDSTRDLDSFAAQVAAMDLVITTSNTTAHMAGALNVPTWVFVPAGFGGLWHWFLDREDSPWYPSVRLLRQAKMNNWTSVIDTACAALADFVDSWLPQ